MKGLGLGSCFLGFLCLVGACQDATRFPPPPPGAVGPVNQLFRPTDAAPVDAARDSAPDSAPRDAASDARLDGAVTDAARDGGDAAVLCFDPFSCTEGLVCCQQTCLPPELCVF